MFDQTLRQRFGHGEDRRVKNEETDPWAISKNSEDLIDSMLNLIVNHKKALKVIPQCSHPDTAREWASKRGLSVSTPDLDNDPATQEVVVWDKSGKRPYVVNGYKLTKSDYPTRNAYWGSHKTAEERVEEPMDEWIENKVYNIKKRPDNQWVTDSIGLGEVGHQIERYGYGLPTKPKKMMTPYAVFSKLIASTVSDFWIEDIVQKRLGVENITNFDYSKILRKIISPITIYRVLYLILIEQKFLFHLIDKNGGNAISYKTFKKYIKEDRGKAAFYDWFYNTRLTGDQKESLNHTLFNTGVVADVLIPKAFSEINFSQPLGIVFILANLIGRSLWTREVPFVTMDGKSYTFKEVIQDDNVAFNVNELLNDPADENKQAKRSLKKQIEICKKISQSAIDDYLSPKNIEALVCNGDYYARRNAALQGTGNENVLTEEGHQASLAAGASPRKENPQ